MTNTPTSIEQELEQLTSAFAGALSAAASTTVQGAETVAAKVFTPLGLAERFIAGLTHPALKQAAQAAINTPAPVVPPAPTTAAPVAPVPTHVAPSPVPTPAHTPTPVAPSPVPTPAPAPTPVAPSPVPTPAPAPTPPAAVSAPPSVPTPMTAPVVPVAAPTT